MKKFRIYYNSGLLTCFSLIEEFHDYETAVMIVKENNKYNVMHPELIQITTI